MSDIVEAAKVHWRYCIKVEQEAKKALDEHFLGMAGSLEEGVAERRGLEDAVLVATEAVEDAVWALAEANRVAATGINPHAAVSGGAL